MTTDLVHSDLADEMRYAQAVAVKPDQGAAQSLLPAAYRGNPANVLIAVRLGKAIGIAPAQALYDIYVVNGRPSPSATVHPASAVLQIRLRTSRFMVIAAWRPSW